jgi:hypothetical protein
MGGQFPQCRHPSRPPKRLFVAAPEGTCVNLKRFEIDLSIIDGRQFMILCELKITANFPG